MTRLALTVFALALASAASAEQFYKWQDETGAWHYTKDAPKGQQTQVINVGRGGATVEQPADTATPAATAAADNAKPGDARPGEPIPASAEALKKVEEAKKARVANCERAKTNVATLESYANVTVQRDGSDVKLNDDEREAELKRARQQVDLFCK